MEQRGIKYRRADGDPARSRAFRGGFKTPAPSLLFRVHYSMLCTAGQRIARRRVGENSERGKALNTLPKEARADSPAAQGVAYCSYLFKIEESLADLTPEERLKKRREKAQPVLDAMLAWAEFLIPATASKSALGKALHYLTTQWAYLIRYLEDGRLEMSNNRAERSIKPFVMGAKTGCLQIHRHDPVRLSTA